MMTYLCACQATEGQSGQRGCTAQLGVITSLVDVEHGYASDGDRLNDVTVHGSAALAVTRLRSLHAGAVNVLPSRYIPILAALTRI